MSSAPNTRANPGEEGFYSSTCERVYLNPGAGKRRTGIASSPWALQEGQDYLANHRSADISYGTIHVWPDNWLVRPRGGCAVFFAAS